MTQCKRMTVLVGLAMTLALAGCQTSQTTSKPKPKPEPAPKTQPKKPMAMPGMVSASVAIPTGNRETSGLLIEKHAPAEVTLGSNFDYMIKVTNLTALELTDVVVTDQFPANFTLDHATPNYQSSEGGSTTWVFAKLAPRETKTITVKGKATTVEALQSCATVSYNSLLCARIPVVQPALKLVKTMTSEVLSCDPIVVTYTVTNTGTGAARDVVVTDNLPEGLMSAEGKNTLSFDAGTLLAGESREFTESLKAAKAGEYTNTATAKSGNNLTAEATAKTVVKEPVLELVQDCPGTEFIGRTICNDFTVTNSGNGVAKNAVVRVNLPAGVQFVSGDGGQYDNRGTVVFSLGDMAAGASKKLKVCYQPTSQGPHKVTSSASAYCAKQVNADCTTQIKGIPAILLEVVDVNDPVAGGKTETYTITATNQGSAVGKNVTMTAILEDAAEYVSSVGATNATVEGKTIKFAPLPALGIGQKATWKVTVKAVQAGDIRFTVKMTEDQLTRPVEENEATNFFK